MNHYCQLEQNLGIDPRKNCQCGRCQIYREQLNAPVQQAQNNYLSSYQINRVMTADDLGLPLSQWDWDWLTDMYGDGRSHRAWSSPDAPYAFWLGESIGWRLGADA